MSINSPSFLGGCGSLLLIVMFQPEQEWRARTVKRKWLAEGRDTFDHDNETARYIWGAVNRFGLIIRS
jgi:hypothetical protein